MVGNPSEGVNTDRKTSEVFKGGQREHSEVPEDVVSSDN